ncbi:MULTISPECIES: hypothetical protein [unclassified Clostridioides]|uniref:hypothetical protein n=1 Tax=unclassified Clostridioides TaxID=2635829 RepID=UPI001D114343|nr:hypothetical protein [Clostridioides sp. ZZV14-6153]MCC0726463.1 hypothetical protein [Clostridioides sp. ZZV14-6045]MCC0739873.1 hypothetical protein [Clostridioides sp. ZZV14-5902]
MNDLNIKGKQKFMNLEIPIIEGGFGEDKKCMTDKTISEIHNMRNADIRRRISDNLKRFKNNIDYVDLKRVHETHTLIELGYSKQSITQADLSFI